MPNPDGLPDGIEEGADRELHPAKCDSRADAVTEADYQLLVYLVNRDGEQAVCEMLGVNRHTLARVLSRLSIRRGTGVLVHLALRRHASAEQGNGVP